jgi:hypothetical protein
MGNTWTPNLELEQQDTSGTVDPSVQANNVGKVSLLWGDGNHLSSGVATCGRRNTNGSVTLTSGDLWLSYLTSYRGSLSGGVVTQVQLRITGTAASGLTLARIGLYTVNSGTSALALVASTTSDTTGWTATFGGVTKPLSTGSPYTLQVGTRYALGVIFVGTTPPTLLQAVGSSDFALNATSPRLCGKLTGQADLPASVADASISTTGGSPYAILMP